MLFHIICALPLFFGFVTRLIRRMSLVEQKLLTLLEYLSSPPGFLWGSCYSIFCFICMFCRSLFVLLFIFFWPLCCLFFLDIRIMITPLVSSVLSVLRYMDYDYPFGIFWPCVVCSSSIYGLWLPLWYLLALCCLFFFDIRIMITPVVSFSLMLSVLLRYTDYDYPFGICWPLCCLFFDIRITITPLVSFGHCVVYSSSIYGLC